MARAIDQGMMCEHDAFWLTRCNRGVEHSGGIMRRNVGDAIIEKAQMFLGMEFAGSFQLLIRLQLRRCSGASRGGHRR